MINKFKYIVIVILHFNQNIEQKVNQLIGFTTLTVGFIYIVRKLVESSALHVVGFYYIVFSFYY